MSHEFDATFKDMASQRPRDLLETFGGPTSLPVRALNVDLSTVTTSADFLIGLGQPLREVVAIDFQSGASRKMAADVLVYNALLYRQYDVPVHSILVLLRRSAEHSAVNGEIRFAPRAGRGRMDFGYEIVRLWERSADSLIDGPLGATPLAVLGDMGPIDNSEQAMRPVVDRLFARLRSDAGPEESLRLMTSAMLLSGLRLDHAVSREVFRGVLTMMENSTVNRGILEEGATKALRRSVLELGTDFLGHPAEAVAQRLQSVEDEARLSRMGRRAPRAASWEEILNTP